MRDILPDTRLKAECVPGWFSPIECRLLYELTVATKGAILEVGHFLGRSTACICEALHDRCEDRVFRSYDLGFRSSEEFTDYYLDLHQRDITVPALYSDFVFSKGLTTTMVARANLLQLELADRVQLISGDAFVLDHYKYDLIFCDAMHDRPEIERNLPGIIRRSNDGCVWALHDMNEQNVEQIIGSAQTIFHGSSGSLGVFSYSDGGKM